MRTVAWHVHANVSARQDREGRFVGHRMHKLASNDERSTNYIFSERVQFENGVGRDG